LPIPGAILPGQGVASARAVFDTEASTPEKSRNIEAIPAASGSECHSGAQAAFSLSFGRFLAQVGQVAGSPCASH
jgi:hypothetical protein